jgi:hypothetical protein
MADDFNDYISLQASTKYCAYTQQYLSLRARQGKLKAVKFGRNWVTKREWVEEYSEKARQYNAKNFGEIFIANIEPPKNLPVAKSKFVGALKISAALAFVCALSGAGIAFGEPSFLTVSDALNPYIGELTASTNILISATVESFENVFADVNDFSDKFANVYYQTGSVAELFIQYGDWVLDKLKLGP